MDSSESPAPAGTCAVPTPEDWIDAARRYSRAVCRNHPHWDQGDIEGEILLACVLHPPQSQHHLSMRCKWATADWQRSRLGRHGHKAHLENAIKLEQPLNDDMPVTVGDLIPSYVDMDDQAVVSSIRNAFPLLMHEREAMVADMLVEGFSQSEIARAFNVTESRISQLVTGRIRPAIERFLRASSLVA